MNERKMIDKLNKYGMNHKRKGGIKDCVEKNVGKETAGKM